MFEKACDKTPVLQDSSGVNTTTSAQVIDQNNADNSTTSTEQNQQQRKDTEEGAMEKISTYLLKVNQLISNSQRLKFVKKTGRLIYTGTQNFRGFTIV